MTKSLLLLCLSLTISGCYDVSLAIREADDSVPPVRTASDCAPIFLGFGGGTATIEAAKGKPARLLEDTEAPRQPIQRIHTIQHRRVYVFLGGAECIEILGE